MRSSIVAAALALLPVSCNTPAPPVTTCGDLALTHPLFVVEQQAGTASGLGLVGADGCFREVPDASLSGVGILADAGARAFFVDQQQGVLDEVDAGALRFVGKPIAVYDAGQKPAEPNPHGLDVDAAGRLWVARYGLGSAAVIAADGSIAASIDLSDLDPDGKPDMEAVKVGVDRVYIALELLDFTKFPAAPRRSGLVAVIDDAPPFKRVKTIDLAGRNPFGAFVPLDATGSRVAIAVPGFIGHVDAGDGIDVLDLATGQAQQLISETELGGSAVQVAVAAFDEAYAIVAGPDPLNPTSVVRFNPMTGKRTAVLATTDTGHYDYVGLAVDGDLVLFGDRNASRSAILAVDRTGAPRGSFTARRLPPWALMTVEK